VFAPQSINGVALYARGSGAITAPCWRVWLAARAGGRSAPLGWRAAGFVAGFAVYLDLFTLQMMPAVGVFALWCALAVPRRAGGRALLIGSAAGVAVVAWSRAQPVADAAKAGMTFDKIGANWTLMVDQCLPYLLGVEVFVQDPVTLGHPLRPMPWPVQVIQAAAACVFVAAVCWAVVAVVRRIGPAPVRRLGALGLVGSAAATGGFLVSTMPADLLSARYLAPIVWLAPFTLAPAAYPLGVRWFAGLIAPLVVAIGIGGWYAFVPYVQDGVPVRDPRGVARDESVLADALRAEGIHHAAAQYWLAYRLTFLFDEDPVVVPTVDADDRYRPYRDGFAAAPVVAYVLPSVGAARAVADHRGPRLDAARTAYRREEIAASRCWSYSADGVVRRFRIRGGSRPVLGTSARHPRLGRRPARHRLLRRGHRDAQRTDHEEVVVRERLLVQHEEGQEQRCHPEREPRRRPGNPPQRQPHDHRRHRERHPGPEWGLPARPGEQPQVAQGLGPERLVELQLDDGPQEALGFPQEQRAA
jgi:hypothetical protein